MLGSVVTEDVINPVYSPVNRMTRLVFVDLRQPLGPLSVAAGKKKTDKGRKEKSLSALQAMQAWEHLKILKASSDQTAHYHGTIATTSIQKARHSR